MFLGCLGYFCSRFSPLSWEQHANMKLTLQWKHTRSGLLQHRCHGQRPPWQHAKLTLLWQYTSKQIVWDLCRDQRVDIIITTQAKIAPTQRQWSCCAQHDKLRSSLLAEQRADICRYITNRDDIDLAPWHIRNHMITALKSTWDCRKHILLNQLAKDSEMHQTRHFGWH